MLDNEHIIAHFTRVRVLQKQIRRKKLNLTYRLYIEHTIAHFNSNLTLLTKQALA